MEDKSLLELVNSALEMLTEIKRRLESGEDAMPEVENTEVAESGMNNGEDLADSSDSEVTWEKDSDTDDDEEAGIDEGWKPVDFFEPETEPEKEPQPAPGPQPAPEPEKESQPAPQPATAPAPQPILVQPPTPVPQPAPAPVPQPAPTPVPQPTPAPQSAPVQSRPSSGSGITLEFGGFSQTIVSSPSASYAPQPSTTAGYASPTAGQPAISAARRPEPDREPAISAARRPGPAPDPVNGIRYAKRMADAAALAAQVCNMWKFQDTSERADEGLLRYAGSEQDAISSLSIVDPDSYYLVSQEGAIGITEDGGESINWLYLPVDKTMSSMPKRLKKGEPWPVEPQKPLEERAMSYDMPKAPEPQGFKFCRRCGNPVKPTAKFCKTCGNRME